MDDIESKINFLVENSDFNDEDIRGLIEQKKAIMHGLLSDYGAIYSVARELGINIEETEELPEPQPLSKLTEGKNISTIVRINPFNISEGISKKSGKPYKLRSFTCIDSEGTEIRGTIFGDGYNHQAYINHLIDKLALNDILFIINGYGEINEYERDGEIISNLQLSINQKSKIIVNPKTDLSIPLLERKFTATDMTLDEIKQLIELEPETIIINGKEVKQKWNINTTGVITEIKDIVINPDISESKTWSQRLNTKIGVNNKDKNGVSCTLWDDMADIELGLVDKVKIINGSLSKRNSRPEISVSKFSTIKILESNI